MKNLSTQKIIKVLDYSEHIESNTPESVEEKHTKLRDILQDYGNEEFGDCIIDEICELFNYPNTIEVVTMDGKISITEVPENYKNLNNVKLRSMFEDEINEPMIYTRLLACGYVGNRPPNFKGLHEDDTWGIDQYDEDGQIVYESFLYTSELEYQQDCKILKL